MAKTAKKTKTPPAEAIPDPVLDLVNSETQVVNTVMASFVSFFTGFRAYLLRAKELERRADETLAKAKTLTEPTNEKEDEFLQAFVKQCNADTKETIEHHGFGKIVHQFHGRITAYRNRGTQPTEEAADIANKLHNIYTRKEQQRVDAENEKRRLAAEAAAKKERDDELAKVEAERLKLEESSADLSAREREYVELVMGGMEASKAATVAGFKDGFKAAARLMASEKIQKAITNARQAKALLEVQEVLKSQPVETANYVAERPNIRRAAGAKDVTRKKMVVENAELFIQAVISGKHGIPHDMLIIDEVRGNEYARSMTDAVKRWPGVRVDSETKVQ
jgi:hypothetical protein